MEIPSPRLMKTSSSKLQFRKLRRSSSAKSLRKEVGENDKIEQIQRELKMQKTQSAEQVVPQQLQQEKREPKKEQEKKEEKREFKKDDREKIEDELFPMRSLALEKRFFHKSMV